MFTKKYNVNEFVLIVNCDKQKILSSIDYYFSIYDGFSENLVLFQKPIEITIQNNNFSKNKNGKLLYEFKRYKLYQISDKIVRVAFYDNYAEFDINIDSLKITGSIKDNEFLGIDFIPNFIIIPLIEILFKYHSIFFIHSSAVSDGINTCLFAGNSGSGKTTISLFFCSKNFKLITDDKSYIYKKNNEIYISGLLQPIDFIKNKDDFLLNQKFMKDILENSTEEDKHYLYKNYNNKNITFGKKLTDIIFPIISEINEKNNISEKDTLLRLLKYTYNPKIRVNSEIHLDILNQLCEQTKNCILKVNNQIYNMSLENIKSLLF